MTNVFWKPDRPVTASFFFISAAGLLFIILISVFTGGPSEEGLVLGLSAERLILIGGMLALFFGLFFLGLQTLWGKIFEFTSPEKSEKPSRRADFVLGGVSLIFALAWLAVWTPAERFGTYYYYFVRVYPFVVWLTCFCAVGLVLLFANRFGVNLRQFKAFLREQRASFWASGVALLVFGVVSWLVVVRVVNMRWYEEDFWYGAGVPLLPLQVLLSVAISIGVGWIVNKFLAGGRFTKKRWLDLILFLVVWAVAAWLWGKEPVNPDFFITIPRAPNFELYPDYDARFFDLVSQYALIGQGLNNNLFYDRPLYSALLVYFHALIGQDYVQLMALQAALFAIFPALGYLLGKRLHSRAGGLGLATLLTLRGISAIEAGAFINTAHQKQMMTDFPSAVLVMLMTVLLVRWLQEPAKNWPSLGWAAGVLGLATLLRPHPLIYLPVLIALVVWTYRQKKHISIVLSSLVLIAALAGVWPWLFSNGQDKSIVDLYLGRVKEVIRTRYPDFKLPGDTMLPPSREIAALNNPGLHFFSVQPQEKSVLNFSVDNFLNNLTGAVQGLPYTPYYQDIRSTVKKSENFWKPYWNGSMSLWAKILLPINLVLVALGLGAAWKRARLSGLIPLIMMAAYYVMNALARTSGGRYLVPVDWVVSLYYFIGILALVEIIFAFFSPAFFTRNAPPLSNPDAGLIFNNRVTWLKIFGIVLSLVMIGTLIPLSGKLFEQRYSSLNRSELIRQVMKQTKDQSKISNATLRKFILTPGSMILQGRILYPREFDKDQGLDISIYAFYHPKPYPRMLLTLLGPQGETQLIFPSTQAVPIPNASDAIILGCSDSKYVQVWAVLLTDSNLIIKRSPASKPLTCPLSEPVCDNNHHCK